MRFADWRCLLRPGDWFVLLFAALLTAALFPLVWRGGGAGKAVVRANGEIVAEVGLNEPRSITVDGPLGITRIEIAPGRARVAADPSPRQYCVRQGWLTQANSIAICAPNRVSLALVGRNRAYDSLNY
ncbi:MAG: NusG domain II-containing protein [Sterolibacteriaceae bacterium]|uniref:NusG domain II-containing protein n=1 Tax=Candidatus Methylophosphatis roskildensis TaxID=2899263 RepID=A0A9D7DWS9_9PROT|nr:NusG domain II-containing protein [Candidatus Methylophosphatis roskildensis]MBK7238389.1 NusG domain II-containing protein [Sterolibacteriaceae bacterium]